MCGVPGAILVTASCALYLIHNVIIIITIAMMGSGHTVVVCMHCGMTMNRRMYRVLPTIGHGLCVTTSRDHGSNAIEHMVASTWESNGLH